MKMIFIRNFLSNPANRYLFSLSNKQR